MTTKPLANPLPYPNPKQFAKDVRAGKIVSFAYATLHGELSAILQYQYHVVQAQDHEEIASLLQSIAMAEMKHLQLLGTALKSLGVDPVYRQKPVEPNVWFNSSEIAYSKTLPKMLLDDIEGEMNAIADYKKMLMLLKNEEVEALIQRITLDEELHLLKLTDAYRDLCQKGKV